MSRRNNYLIVILILVLAFFAGNLSYPKYFNQAIDYLNSKFSILNSRFKLPYFWEKPFKLGLDLQGGVQLLYQADLSNVKPEDKNNSLQGLRDVIERRVNLFGAREPVVQLQGDKLVVELAGTIDPNQAITEIGKTPFLEFKELRHEDIVKQIEAKQKEIQGLSTMEEIQKVENWRIAFEDPFQPTPLTGKYLSKAELGFDQTTYKPMVQLQFNDEGAKIFEELTSRNVEKPLAISIDGIVISAPVVQQAIPGGSAQITGNFTPEEARNLARNLNAGALPVPIKLISQQTVGPTLGKIALDNSLKAGLFGFLAVILFMIIFYRIPGLIAGIALTIYIFFILALFKLIPVTLTLAGIGGFILSIGMAVDANILIFSRVREELKEKKDYSISLEEGFRRAWPAIRDTNFTTLLVSIILFSFGTSFVKGFALALIIGVLMSMFSAIVITRNFLEIFLKAKLQRWAWLWR